jgi:TPR repeat protein
MKHLNKKLALVIMLFFMLSNVNSVMADSNKDDLIKLAENGDKVAQYSLANLLLAQHIDKNNKIKKYDNEVVYWYQQSAEQGYPEAQFALAMIYIQQKNNELFINWLKKAAEQNHAQAQYYLGFHYLFVPDHPKSLYWLTKAAKQGYTPTQVELGNLYLTSHLAEADDNIAYKKAIYWYKKAAEANNPYAQFNLGLIEKANSNHKQALYWFKQACKHNFNDACHLASTIKVKKDNHAVTDSVKENIDLYAVNATTQGYPFCYFLFVDYYPNGRIKEEGCQGHYNGGGIQVGNWYEYDFSGKLVRSIYYHPDEYGKDYKIVITYDKNGGILTKKIFNHDDLYGTVEEELNEIPK